jgi:hypothetical protein
MRFWTFEGNLPMLRLAAMVFSAWGLLSGCTGPTYSYSKAGSDVADFRQDSYACVQEPRVAWGVSWGVNGSPMTVGARTDTKRQAILYRRCMEASGWASEAPQ